MKFWKHLIFGLALTLGMGNLASAQMPGMMPPGGPGMMPPGYPGAAGMGMMPKMGPQGPITPAAFFGGPGAVPVVGGSAGCATGNCGAPGAGYGGEEPSRFGYHPVIKRLFNIRGKGECGNGNCNGGRGGAGYGPAGYGPGYPGMGGTLVFPQNPYVRAPRDFFEP